MQQQPQISAHSVAAEGAHLARIDRLIWSFVAAAAAVVLAAALAGPFRILWPSFLPPVAAAFGLAFASWFYRRYRNEPKLASALEGTAQVIAFAAAAAPLSYLAATLDLPLQDHALDAVDRALGFDWIGMLDWLRMEPVLRRVFRLTYMSLTLQMTVVVLCLAFSGRLIWLRTYTLAFIFAALVTIAVSALLPAEGEWLHHNLVARDHGAFLPLTHTAWPVFHALRDGSLRTLMGIGAEGVVTFPSLHAALAVILIFALWPVAVLRWPVFAVNTLMLAATPVDGAHYLIDVIAGVALAALCWKAAAAVTGRRGAAIPAPALTVAPAAGTPIS